MLSTALQGLAQMRRLQESQEAAVFLCSDWDGMENLDETIPRGLCLF